MRARRAGLLIILLIAALPAAAQTGLIERGRHLVEGIAACGNCHTPKGPGGEVPAMTLAGGFVIDIPKDVQQAKFQPVFPATVEFRNPTLSHVPHATDEQLKQILALIAEAKKPVLYVGGGVISAEASADLKAFAEKVNVPVATTHRAPRIGLARRFDGNEVGINGRDPAPQRAARSGGTPHDHHGFFPVCDARRRAGHDRLLAIHVDLGPSDACGLQRGLGLLLQRGRNKSNAAKGALAALKEDREITGHDQRRDPGKYYQPRHDKPGANGQRLQIPKTRTGATFRLEPSSTTCGAGGEPFGSSAVNGGNAR